MTTTSPRLVNWENGTDLVIELPLAVDIATVWSKLVDSETAGSWFGSFTVDEAAASTDDEAGSVEATDADSHEASDDDSADATGSDSDDATDDDGESNPAITFDLGETELHGEILSCEPHDHVLVELEDFGVLGMQLLALELTDGDATLLIFTQSAPDVESARLKAADFGPMWDTHLRLFARVLGLEVAEAGEAELLALYADLELEDSVAEDSVTEDGLDLAGSQDGASSAGPGSGANET